MTVTLSRTQNSRDTENARYLVKMRELINIERDRRTDVGFSFMGKVIQFRSEDKMRISGGAALAGFAIAAGAQPGNHFWHGGSSPFQWIAADNTTLSLDAPSMFALGQAAAAHETAHVFAAKTLKEMDPVPSGYQDDAYWPPAPT